MSSSESNSRLVYSTEQVFVCPGCLKPIKKCICNENSKTVLPVTDGVVRVCRETKGRKGKGVTLIIGLSLNEDGLTDLARKLKQRFATGGSVKKWNIELQGDHREAVIQELRAMGFSVKSG